MRVKKGWKPINSVSFINRFERIYRDRKDSQLKEDGTRECLLAVICIYLCFWQDTLRQVTIVQPSLAYLCSSLFLPKAEIQNDELHRFVCLATHERFTNSSSFFKMYGLALTNVKKNFDKFIHSFVVTATTKKAFFL